MIIYGKNVLEALQDDPSQIRQLYIQSGLRDPKIQKLVDQWQKNIQIKTISRRELDSLTDNGVHNGVAAKVKDIDTVSLEQLMAQAKKKAEAAKDTGRQPLIIALDSIQDPHNVGAILRSADAAGADGVILCKHKAAGLTPTAIKASAGAAYSVPVHVAGNLSKALSTLKENGYWVAGTDFDAQSVDYRKPEYDTPLVLVIGNEGKGISPGVKKQCDFKVHLPMNGEVQSLNASVAAGILMYKIQEKRQKSFMS